LGACKAGKSPTTTTATALSNYKQQQVTTSLSATAAAAAVWVPLSGMWVSPVTSEKLLKFSASDEAAVKKKAATASKAAVEATRRQRRQRQSTTAAAAVVVAALDCGVGEGHPEGSGDGEKIHSKTRKAQGGGGGSIGDPSNSSSSGNITTSDELVESDEAKLSSEVDSEVEARVFTAVVPARYLELLVGGKLLPHPALDKAQGT
jgi:hypothetical protein